MKNFHKSDSSHKIKVLNSNLRNAQSLHSTKLRGNWQDNKKVAVNTIKNVPIYLFYKKKKIMIKVDYGLPYSCLVEKLYQELFNFEF